MKDDLSQEQIDEILKVLDDILEEGPWDKSTFLRVIGKNITKIREDFVHHIESKQQGKAKKMTNLADRMALRSGQQEIYILLYSSEGGKLQSWERIIANLPLHTTSRPIYANEEDVKAAIRSKTNKINEAYVAVFVSQSDLLSVPEDKIPVDKLGKKLLTLKDKTLNLNNIRYFKHQSGIYRYSGGRLIKSSKENSSD
ncbi:Dot/Icm secretion system protein IcmQ [Legionella israelensis]|uniref:IcmQ n=1 Tax=Legionella israelensis TaxID=454 RepID=Q49J14_9GAMM|nr:Dot/Icm secretion system protein IcmQ [Legionella israelensis]AAX56262.1 IcmQ [Legionella israelensis]KTD28722.1 IcmQ protein [Legionella israelensis]QBR83238.1 Dot/Icm secretion system protein IcmQ [Legionella israelensis]QBS09385.1 Dot/Icm secretion system protein IcmQ [Legionella israelensis]QDP71767.1 Dot/Icm secretion system protein IcmQ [Legionella israelensis]